jgi:hypothetical protein
MGSKGEEIMFGIDAIGAVSGLFKTVVEKVVPDADVKVQLQQGA